ncbi:chaplin [Streptomyces sp. NPDC048304]|uniref:chaplin n=1 Tax=Streptomyces sp. NPDC048304 TaxID=3154820 RepID=UPI0033D05FEE
MKPIFRPSPPCWRKPGLPPGCPASSPRSASPCRQGPDLTSVAAGTTSASSGARPAAARSRDVRRGNVVDVPTRTPVNVCGNTLNGVGPMNPRPRIAASPTEVRDRRGQGAGGRNRGAGGLTYRLNQAGRSGRR